MDKPDTREPSITTPPNPPDQLDLDYFFDVYDFVNTDGKTINPTKLFDACLAAKLKTTLDDDLKMPDTELREKLKKFESDSIVRACLNTLYEVWQVDDKELDETHVQQLQEALLAFQTITPENKIVFSLIAELFTSQLEHIEQVFGESFGEHLTNVNDVVTNAQKRNNTEIEDYANNLPPLDKFRYADWFTSPDLLKSISIQQHVINIVKIDELINLLDRINITPKINYDRIQGKNISQDKSSNEETIPNPFTTLTPAEIQAVQQVLDKIVDSNKEITEATGDIKEMEQLLLALNKNPVLQEILNGKKVIQDNIEPLRKALQQSMIARRTTDRIKVILEQLAGSDATLNLQTYTKISRQSYINAFYTINSISELEAYQDLTTNVTTPISHFVLQLILNRGDDWINKAKEGKSISQPYTKTNEVADGILNKALDIDTILSSLNKIKTHAETLTNWKQKLEDAIKKSKDAASRSLQEQLKTLKLNTAAALIVTRYDFPALNDRQREQLNAIENRMSLNIQYALDIGGDAYRSKILDLLQGTIPQLHISLFDNDPSDTQI